MHCEKWLLLQLPWWRFDGYPSYGRVHVCWSFCQVAADACRAACLTVISLMAPILRDLRSEIAQVVISSLVLNTRHLRRSEPTAVLAKISYTPWHALPTLESAICIVKFSPVGVVLSQRINTDRIIAWKATIHPRDRWICVFLCTSAACLTIL